MGVGFAYWEGKDQRSKVEGERGEDGVRKDFFTEGNKGNEGGVRLCLLWLFEDR